MERTRVGRASTLSETITITRDESFIKDLFFEQLIPIKNTNDPTFIRDSILLTNTNETTLSLQVIHIQVACHAPFSGGHRRYNGHGATTRQRTGSLSEPWHLHFRFSLQLSLAHSPPSYLLRDWSANELGQGLLSIPRVL